MPVKEQRRRYPPEAELTAIRNGANCRGLDTDEFFRDVGESNYSTVRSICMNCEVMEQCLEYAVRYHMLGFWGGTTEEERRSIRHKRTAEKERARRSMAKLRNRFDRLNTQ